MAPSMIDRLIRDHLFLQNLVMWLAQPLTSLDDVRPILHEQGFSIVALGRLLSLPADVRASVRVADLATQQSTRPDVLLRHEAERKYFFVECKENSFGPQSTTANQARTLLLVAGPRAAETLGLDRREVTASYLGFMVPDDKVALLTKTLGSLHAEMAHARLPSGQSSVFGLAAQSDEISLSIDDGASSFVGLEPGNHVCMWCEPGNDPRPFYFMPYDPGVHQSPEEKAKSELELFKRIQQHVLADVGGVRVPVEIRLSADSLLDRVYSGIYSLWEERDDKAQVRRLGNRYLNRLARAVHSTSPRAMVQEGNVWKVTLDDQEPYERVVNALMRFDPEVPDAQDTMPRLPES